MYIYIYVCIYILYIYNDANIIIYYIKNDAHIGKLAYISRVKL